MNYIKNLIYLKRNFQGQVIFTFNNEYNFKNDHEPLLPMENYTLINFYTFISFTSYIKLKSC